MRMLSIIFVYHVLTLNTLWFRLLRQSTGSEDIPESEVSMGLPSAIRCLMTDASEGQFTTTVESAGRVA